MAYSSWTSEAGEFRVVPVRHGFARHRRHGGERTRGGSLARASRNFRLTITLTGTSHSLARRADAEEGDQRLERFCLRRELFRRRCHFLGGSGVALRQFVDASHGLVHL